MDSSLPELASVYHSTAAPHQAQSPLQSSTETSFTFCLALMVRVHWRGINLPTVALVFGVCKTFSSAGCCHIWVFLGHFYLTRVDF